MSIALAAGMVEGIVIELNNEIEDRDGLSSIHHISFTSDGNSYSVNFAGNELWNSEDDARETDYTSDGYKTIKEFIKCNYNELIDEFQLQKI